MVDCKSFVDVFQYLLIGYELVAQSTADREIELSQLWPCRQKNFILEVSGNYDRIRVLEVPIFSVFRRFRSILIIDAPPKVGMG